jgi:hypothetical protein
MEGSAPTTSRTPAGSVTPLEDPLKESADQKKKQEEEDEEELKQARNERTLQAHLPPATGKKLMKNVGVAAWAFQRKAKIAPLPQESGEELAKDSKYYIYIYLFFKNIYINYCM